jgi:hypothetical protein
MRRIYLAGRFSRQEELRFYGFRLRQLGATVDARWLDREESDWSAEDIRGGSAYAQAMGRVAAREDYKDIGRSNMLLSFTENDDAGYTSGGRHVEFGWAYAMGLTLAIVGPRENVFHCADGVTQFDDFDAFIESDYLRGWLRGRGLK